MWRNIFVQSFVVWIILAFITILFAIFREAVFIPATGLNFTLARALLLPVGLAYTFAIAYIFLKNTKVPYKRSDTIKIGFLWLLLTTAFEFIFGSLVMGNSLSALVADYNIFVGRTWPFFLLGLLLAPFIAERIVKRSDKRTVPQID
jgi:hypothetical protein